MTSPDPWPKRRLGDVASMGSGGTPPSKVGSYYGGGIPWVSISDMTATSKYVTTTVKTLSQSGLDCSAAKLYAPGAVLYAMYASIGECVIARGRVASSQAILGIVPGAELDPEFLYYYLDFIKPVVKKQGQQGTQANLNLQMVRDFEVPVPPIWEQRRVAGVLGDLDGHLEGLKALHSKKQALRLGLAQNLLTGRMRLPGYSGAWMSVALGDILEFKNGLSKAREFFGHGTPIVNFMDVMNGPTISSTDLTGRVALTRDEINRFSALRGDIFFTRTSETVEEIGTAAALLDDVQQATFSGFILRGRPRPGIVNSRFLSYQCGTARIRSQITASASYTTRALTNGRLLSKVVTQLPSMDEQNAISEVLSDADAELVALDVQIEKFRSVMTAVRQQLLTGRTRLTQELAA